MKIAHLAAAKSYAYFELWRQKVNGGQEINFTGLAGFLTSRGYFLFRNNVNKHIYIRIIDNIVCEVGKKDIVDDILSFVRDPENEPAYIYEFFLKNISKTISDDFLMTLPAKDVKFKKDTKDAMQLYYRNCIVKITKDKVTVHDYTKLNGFIWESQIIDRDFDLDREPGSDFKRFIWNVSNKQDDRYSSICSAIGFMLHTYKSPAYCPAIILNDEVISDHPEGGTGKGLIVKAINKFRNTVTIDGKTFDFKKTFLYQRVNKDTEIIAFEDVQKNFDFEKLFSVITEGIAIEVKGVTETYIDFEDSPKIIVTTNYALKGQGNSHDRRKEELEITQFYSKSRTPLDDFGRMLFSDWDEEDYMNFEQFIVECCQHYLRNGLVHQQLINLPQKRLLAETCEEFIEFMNESDFRGQRISRIDFYIQFKAENPTSKYAAKTFNNFVKKYMDFHRLPMSESKSGAIRYFNF